jgi:acylphosphatase
MNTSSSSIGQQFLISGRVQGVFYRRFAKQTAMSLGITGWVRNLSPGDVEVHAFGLPAQLALYEKRLWEGPFAARVKNVSVHPIAWTVYSTFEIVEDA